MFLGDWVGDVCSEVVGVERIGSRDVDHVRRVVCGAEVLPEGGKWLVFCLQVDWHAFHFISAVL